MKFWFPLGLGAIATASITFADATQLHPSSLPPNPSLIAQKVAPQAPPYPRRPIVLQDATKPSTSFYQFRERLRQAVKQRNAKFIRSIADPNIQLGFGRPRPLDSLEINNPNSPFWKQLERTLATGCALYEAPAGTAQTPTWACPHVFQASLGDPFSDIYIVAEGVNVRAQPLLNSAVVDVLSHEVVKIDPKAFSSLSEAQLAAAQTLDGWYPVITPSGYRGFVSSRFAYIPAGYRAIFASTQNGWKMTAFLAGD